MHPAQMYNQGFMHPAQTDSPDFVQVSQSFSAGVYFPGKPCYICLVKYGSSLFGRIMIKRKFGLSVLLLLTIIFFCGLPETPAEAKSDDLSSFISAVVISSVREEMNIGETVSLYAVSSDFETVKWKSSNSKVASVDAFGRVTAKKAGTCTITAKTKNAYADCLILVKKTEIRLEKTSVALYRGQTFSIEPVISSGNTPAYSSSRSSIASVDEEGVVTANRNGTAVITVRADGVTKKITVKVKKPKIVLNQENITLHVGESFQFKARVSSGNKPEWSVSSTRKADIDDNGLLKAYERGKLFVYAKEDGTRVRAVVVILEKGEN